MLTVDGYASLKQFYSAAKNAIRERTNARWDEIRAEWLRSRSDEGEVTDDNGPQRTEFYYHNVEYAAQYLVYDALLVRSSRGDGQVQVLRPDGVKVGIPLSLISPICPLRSYREGYSRARYAKRQEKIIDDGERIFGLDTLKLDFWPDYFLTEQVFGAPTVRYLTAIRRLDSSVSIVDWENGCIDLQQRRALIDATALLADGALMLRRAGFTDLPRLLENDIYQDLTAARNTLKVLEPFQACSVVAPADWLQDLRTHRVSGSQLANLDVANGVPQEMISALVAARDGASKKQIKSEILEAFPAMSHRQFERHWAAVADQMPELRKPGRKSKRRIETLAD